MQLFKRWGDRFTGSLKSSLSIALLAHAEEKSSQYGPEIRKDYDEFTSMVQSTVLGGTDSMFAHNLNRKGLKLLSKFHDKIDWLLYAGDFDKALEYIHEAITISIISGATQYEKDLETTKTEALIEQTTTQKMIRDAQKIADILKEDPEGQSNVLFALAIAVKSVDDAQNILMNLSTIKGNSLKKWQDQIIKTKDGIVTIMDRKLDADYKAAYRAKIGSPMKTPNIKGKGWMVYYRPGKIVSTINHDYRQALGMSREITHSEVDISLREYDVYNEDVSRTLWEELVK